jgi:hypothetical protein
LEGRYLRSSFARVATASAAMAVPIYLVHSYVFRTLPDTRLADLVQLAVLLPLALVLFLGVARALGVQEIDFALHSFVIPTWRRIFPQRAKILN